MIIIFDIGDFVVYKREVCKIVGIKEKYYKDMDYFSLELVLDSTLKIDVPKNSNLLKCVLSKEEVEEIINRIPLIDYIDMNDKMLENEYKKLLHDGGYDGLIKIIKTTYLRNSDRLNNKKKVSEKDENYFNLAEKYLYNEFAVALGISPEEAKEYVINKVNELSKE